MAKTRIRRLGSHREAENFLQGGIVGGSFKSPAYNLDGLTLIFSSPAAETVTFSASAAQAGMTVKEIVDQIAAQTTDVIARAVLTPGGTYRIALVHDNASPSEITLGSGTGNAALGFSNGQTGVVYAAPSGVAPRWLAIFQNPLTDSALYIATEE